MSDDACICKGNWRLIVSQTEHLLGKTFRRDDGKEYWFFGVVHAEDDYYYGMWGNGELRLLSCVGSIEGHGYKLVADDSLEPTEEGLAYYKAIAEHPGFTREAAHKAFARVADAITNSPEDADALHREYERRRSP